MNYKDTVFLPVTTMPVRASIANEETILSGWSDLYRDMAALNPNGPEFVLHDGPPYANGGIHLGHALNKILKDMTVRSRIAMGYRSEFRPGWDCHGLPIEWKVEEEWRKKKLDKNLDPSGFRMDCRKYAEGWVDHQRDQFKRLGIMADWSNPYLTMSQESEIAIMKAFHRLVLSGKVYRENKPTMWSPVEKTALSDAEAVEHEHSVPNIWVRFPVVEGPLVGLTLLVWTTTPWSLPGNVAVAMNPNIQYGIYQVGDEKLVVADSLADSVFHSEYVRIGDAPELTGWCRNPLGDKFQKSEIIAADFVREGSGTGLVHVGPAHSVEDWVAWKRHIGHTDRPYPNPVMENGVYSEDVPIFAGLSVTRGKKFGPANDAIVSYLEESDMLYRVESRPMTLSHSWRSDAILLTISTPQWFISLEQDRDRVLSALSSVEVTPYSAKVRMFNMTKTRPDWLVSRQRLWGAPLGLFINQSGEMCSDERVLNSTIELLRDGTERWFDLTPEMVFRHAGVTGWEEYSRVDDVLDVWFDSSQVQYLLGGKQADLVIEGTDQARGWFGSSLWASVLDDLDGRAYPPHRNIMTHGFILDQSGRKMSKSLGNVIDPEQVVNKYGADALRVWVANTDWQSDMRVGEESLKNSAEIARKLRNSLRYFSGALHKYTRGVGSVILPELEQFILQKLYDLDRGADSISSLIREQKFTLYLSRMMDFCQMISSVWLDVRKDVLYCSERDDETRVAYLTTLKIVFDHLTVWLAPVLVFAAEEAWQSVGRDGSVHCQRWPVVPTYRDDLLMEKWENYLSVRDRVFAKIEKARAEGVIKSAGEASLFITMADDLPLPRDLAELLMVASVDLEYQDDEHIVVMKTNNRKCERCWQHNIDQYDVSALCDRCNEVIDGMDRDG